MKKKILIPLSLAAISLVAAAATYVARPDLFNSSIPTPQEKKLWLEIRKGVADQLLDPGSAVFTCVTFDNGPLSDGRMGYRFIGQVNAKNKFGGYTGDRTFIWTVAYEEIERKPRPTILKKYITYPCPETDHFK
ncbi:hypothetical protein [Thauera chlorobenzoica]|uniref:hypothetical protein n=1 Tax=Thauera chlorobenzoica TaxID=96773 RepID=UPI0008A02F8E|nr:hypothetical protein [Thauera chlorobenzoica]SEG07888.1 hypothetical protein SAMN05216242_1163 [Thauera chlorobenzoica]